MNNKKGVVKLFGFILGFSFLLLLVIFATLLIKDIGKNEVLDRIDNVSLGIEDDLGVSDAIKTHIHDLPDEYDNMTIPYDLFFVASIISAFIISLVASYKAKEQSMFSFFGSITLGLIMLLFFTGFIDVINSWFVLNFINGVLSFNLSSTPLINNYINNLGFYNLIWGAILIMVNKLNFTFARETEDLGGGFEQ